MEHYSGNEGAKCPFSQGAIKSAAGKGAKLSMCCVYDLLLELLIARIRYLNIVHGAHS